MNYRQEGVSDDQAYKTMKKDHLKLVKCCEKGGYVPKTKDGHFPKNNVTFDDECNCEESNNDSDF